MIFTEQKPREEILGFLKGRGPVFIVGCSECATACHTGGEEEARQMKGILEEQGIPVSGHCVPESPCVAANVKNALAGFAEEVKRSGAVLVMACGMGAQTVKDNLHANAVVVPCCNSMFPASLDAKGGFRQNCVVRRLSAGGKRRGLSAVSVSQGYAERPMRRDDRRQMRGRSGKRLCLEFDIR